MVDLLRRLRGRRIGRRYPRAVYRPLTLLAVVALLGAGGCGQGSSADESAGEPAGGTDELEVAVPDWATPYLAAPGPESALVLGSSDFATGENRVTFLLVRDDGSTVSAPTLDVAYQPGDNAPVRETTARLVPFGAEGAEEGDVTAVYVATLESLEEGKRWIVVESPGEALQGFQTLSVKQRSLAPAVGEPAPKSDNPTILTSRAKDITTARPPDVELLRHSVADSIADGVPFVVAFATPQFCQTRACGPTVDIVDVTRKRFKDANVRFIHIEIYEDNTPGKGMNRWVREWNLPTEPWVFVVDRRGIVRARFEGPIAADELEAAVHAVLER